jgi:hypothetical protein
MISGFREALVKFAKGEDAELPFVVAGYDVVLLGKWGEARESRRSAWPTPHDR